MALWETLTGWIDRERRTQVYLQIEPAHVHPPLEDKSLIAGGSYVRVRLANMFLRKQVFFAKTWYPAVHSLVRFNFGNQTIDLPSIADSTQVGMQKNNQGDVIAHNFELTPTMPFNGGIMSLSAGMIALEGENYLESTLTVLGRFADQLKIAQLSTALNIVQPLALGIQDLFGAGNGRVHLGFHNSYAADELRNGYIAAVRATQEEIDPTSLYIQNNQLYIDAGDKELKPLEGYDYMLFRVEVFEQRDDWNKLVSIQEPFQEAIKALSDPETEGQAAKHLRTALLRVRQSPELTEAHRRIVNDRLIKEFDEAQQNFRVRGLRDEALPSLKQVMHGKVDIKAALRDRIPTLNEIEDKIAEFAPHITFAEEPWDIDIAEDTLPQVDESQAAFYFSLLGEAVDSDRVQCGSNVDLIFNYAVPALESLATVTGKSLEEIRQQRAELGVAVIPVGFKFRDNLWYQVARFSEGRLESPISFKLKAADEPVENSVLHVIFDHKGYVLYEFDLPVECVVSVGDSVPIGKRTPLNLNLDELRSEEEERKDRTATLVIQGDADAMTFFYKEADSFQPLMGSLKISQTKLATILGATAEMLKPVYGHAVWTNAVNPLEAPMDDARAEAYEECLKYVVSAGSALFEALASDEKLAAVLEKINGLKPGSRLQIITDCAFIPWEILYREQYHYDWDANLIQTQELWGARFIIECLLLGANDEYKTPLAQHRKSPAFVSFNLNPTIDETFKNPNYKPVASQIETITKDYHKGRVGTELNVGQDPIKFMLNKAGNTATLIYFYCHGSNLGPFTARRELLEIDKVKSKPVFVEPHSLNKGIKFANAPIIFLNSCSSGSFSPLSFATFLTRFKEKQALGLIATSFPIPITFGAAFGQALIEGYITGAEMGLSIGDVLRNLRLRFLQDKNPVGLFYTLQCPLDATAATIDKGEN